MESLIIYFIATDLSADRQVSLINTQKICDNLCNLWLKKDPAIMIIVGSNHFKILLLYSAVFLIATLYNIQPINAKNTVPMIKYPS